VHDPLKILPLRYHRALFLTGRHDRPVALVSFSETMSDSVTFTGSCETDVVCKMAAYLTGLPQQKPLSDQTGERIGNTFKALQADRENLLSAVDTLTALVFAPTEKDMLSIIDNLDIRTRLPSMLPAVNLSPLQVHDAAARIVFDCMAETAEGICNAHAEDAELIAGREGGTYQDSPTQLLIADAVVKLGRCAVNIAKLLGVSGWDIPINGQTISFTAPPDILSDPGGWADRETAAWQREREMRLLRMRAVAKADTSEVNEV
jgi:hypothetical protein